jgi:N-acetylglucosamine malate deacetylase 1
MADAVLSILAHPDDAEFVCAGTLARLRREHGWEVHIATMTPGDCGSAELGPEVIAGVRREEGRRAAVLIEGTYHCLESRDLLVFYDAPHLEKVIRLLREVRPRIVITHSPQDYMLDHEQTSVLARAAAFGAPIRNMFADRGHPPALDHIPHLYYADPIEGKDTFGRPVEAGFCVEITTTLDVKREMLCCHASQREWLLKHHGMDEYVAAMESWAADRGRLAGVPAAEGFRQHLGHSYPQENLLGALLGGSG